MLLMTYQGVCTERVIAMCVCVLCPVQASLTWSTHIIRVSDRNIKVQWLEIACTLLSRDKHILLLLLVLGKYEGNRRLR